MTIQSLDLLIPNNQSSTEDLDLLKELDNLDQILDIDNDTDLDISPELDALIKKRLNKDIDFALVS